jgi:hypothetical protein
MTVRFDQALLEELSALIAPLTAATEDPSAIARFFQLVGWDAVAIAGGDLVALGQALGPLVEAIAAAGEAVAAGGGVAETGPAIAQVLLTLEPVVRQVAGWQMPGGLSPTLAGQMAADIVNALVDAYLVTRRPVLRAVLVLLGVIEFENAPLAVSNGRAVRRAMRRPVLRPERLGDMVKDPLGYLAARAGAAATPQVLSETVLPILRDLAEDLGLQPVLGGLEPADGGTPDDVNTANRLLVLNLWRTRPDPEDASIDLAWMERVILGFGTDPSGGPALLLAASNEIAFGLANEAIDLELALRNLPRAVFIGASGVTIPGGAPLQAPDFAVRVARPGSRAPSGSKALQFGAEGGTGLSIAGIGVTLDLQLAPAPALAGTVALTGIEFGLGSEGLDGFLAENLPSATQKLIGGDATLRFSTRDGLGLSGSVAADHEVPGRLELGPVGLGPARVRLRADGTGLTLTGSTRIDLHIGPISAEVTGLGLKLGLTLPDGAGPMPAAFTVGIVPPTGIALKIEAGPVKGGGFLMLDAEAGQYAGAVQLSVKAIGLTAVGIVNTRLPDGSDGFSMIVVIAADFPSIPLPFGFALNGVGGLVGIHRRMDTQALKLKVAEGALGSILFPRDPVGRIHAVLGDLSAIFPVEEGRYVFGPMVRLTWGPAGLLSIEVAVILDIPSPLRLAILGRMRLVLPDPESALADIRLDVAGILDFERQTAVVAASLIDSKLFGFTLTGDMGMLLGWGATKAFAITMGGFYPGFPVPDGLPPRFNRLTLALGSGANPRLRLETYFAVTSNTLQFGGALDVHASEGDFAVTGRLSLDAFLQFDPFRLEVELRAMLALLMGGKPLLSAQLQARLTGPNPWHLKGEAVFQIIVPLRIPFEVTIGQPQPVEQLRVNLVQMLADEIARKESWAAAPEAVAGRIVTLREGEGDSAVIHPLSQLSLTQRALPLNKVITRYGAAVPEGGPVRFHLTRLALVGAPSDVADATELVFADFAPGQYEALSDAEKLSRPDFEQMPAGARLAALPTSLSLAAQDWTPGYEDFVLDTPATLRVAGTVDTLEDDPEVGLAVKGTGVRLRAERFVLADADTLETPWPLIATSRAEAADRLAALPLTERAQRVIVPVANSWVMP